jgi:hypothetical protein
VHPRGVVCCGVQKGVNVLQACNSPMVKQSHKPARSGPRLAKLATRRHGLTWLLGLVAFLVLSGGIPGSQDSRLALVTSSARAAESPGFPQEPSRHSQPQQGPGPTETAPPVVLSQKQKKDLLKDNFAKMKRDADELADLAKSLQEDLNKSNENVFSLGVVDKADKIEKLAKKIKGAARGY